MGNRAVITTEDHRIGVYLHWNGGRDSVEAFLEYCRLHGFRKPEDDDYGWARLCQVICNFVGADGCSAGIDEFERLDSDNGDNGVYVIKGWEIVSREFFEGEEQCEYELDHFIREIDDCMPEPHRIGHRMIEDLRRTGKTLNDIGCDYYYSIWKRKNKAHSGFQIGKEYRSGDISVTVMKRLSDDRISVDTGGSETEFDVFHWKDGSESIAIGTDISCRCISSFQEE